MLYFASVTWSCEHVGSACKEVALASGVVLLYSLLEGGGRNESPSPELSVCEICVELRLLELI